MKVFRSAGVIALLASPAYLASPVYAQMPAMNLLMDKGGKTQEEKDADEVRDKAYRESLKKIPDAKTSADPWGNVRSDPPKASVNAAPKTPAKPKTKTATNPN